MCICSTFLLLLHLFSYAHSLEICKSSDYKTKPKHSLLWNFWNWRQNTLASFSGWMCKCTSQPTPSTLVWLCTWSGDLQKLTTKQNQKHSLLWNIWNWRQITHASFSGWMCKCSSFLLLPAHFSLLHLLNFLHTVPDRTHSGAQISEILNVTPGNPGPCN